MKKFIAIAVIAIVALTSVFAATDPLKDEITVTAKVGVTTITDAAEEAADNDDVLFGLYGGLTAQDISKKGTLATGIDISEEDATVYFKITQNYKIKCIGTAKLTVTVGAMFKGGDTSGTVADKTATALPTVANVTGNPLSGALTISPATTDNVVEFTLGYLSKQNAVDPRDIATFSATWAKVADLVDGTYSANVAMVCTVE